MRVLEESTERNDQNNWVKHRLLSDGYVLISFEGYTVRGGETTALFDRRRIFDDTIASLSASMESMEKIVADQERYLDAKLAFARQLNVPYYYVFYRYADNENSEKLYTFRFDRPNPVPSGRYVHRFNTFNNFCDFIHKTKFFRSEKMTSPYQEKEIPEIDKIFRNRCQYPWMGNLDGLILLKGQNKAFALIEFQTTNKSRVKDHCNNTWFLSSKNRKGDEMRWRIAFSLSEQAGLPLVVIVWSSNEINGDIKFKIVSDVVYSNDDKNRKPGLIYSTYKIVSYQGLLSELQNLAEQAS